MAFEVFYLAIGLIVGAMAVYVFLSRKMYSSVQTRAELTATRLFEAQKQQLEQSIRETYLARLEQWKATELAQKVEYERLDAIEKSRSVIKGKVAEHLAPFLPEFLSKYNPSDARFLGSPVDYIIFKNLNLELGDHPPIEVVFLDVKTGESMLTRNEKRIEQSVNSGRVRFETLRLDWEEKKKLESY